MVLVKRVGSQAFLFIEGRQVKQVWDFKLMKTASPDLQARALALVEDKLENLGLEGADIDRALLQLKELM